MIHVLTFSDREVKTKLFDQVAAASRPLVVCATRHGPFMRPLVEREPFASLERAVGRWADQLVVLDEGTVEGMWRDPVGDLADALFPHDRARAFASAAGYTVLLAGAPRAVVKKHGPEEDLFSLHEALAALGVGIPPPDPSRRPRAAKKPGASARARRAAPGQDEQTPPRAGPAARPSPSSWADTDPWTLLGILPGTPHAEARRAFHALIAQYHPDKVAHLAPEFRTLAEERTRVLLEAWAHIEPQLPR